jgi:hypothetical protein
MATSDYGATYTFNGSSLGAARVIGYPEVSTEAIETTTHASAGVREYIPSGLLQVGEFTIELMDASSVVSTIDTAIDSKTIANSVIANGVETMTFSSFILSYKVEDADATGPDADRLTVVVRPTGAITLT